jgi:hypothetical protein
MYSFWTITNRWTIYRIYCYPNIFIIYYSNAFYTILGIILASKGQESSKQGLVLT